jgi:hypothetical protein
MFTVIHDAVFVALSTAASSTIQDVLLMKDLQEINRSDFTLLDMPPGGEGLKLLMPRAIWVVA